MRRRLPRLSQWAVWCVAASRPLRSHLCRLCGKAFKYDTSLMHHMKVHRGETTCQVCGKVLSRTGQLQNHMLSRHPELMPPPPRDPELMPPPPPPPPRQRRL